MKKAPWLSSFDSLFNEYREDTNTLTHSLNLNDPHMQMSYIWARMMLKRGPGMNGLHDQLIVTIDNSDLFYLFKNG